MSERSRSIEIALYNRAERNAQRATSTVPLSEKIQTLTPVEHRAFGKAAVSNFDKVQHLNPTDREKVMGALVDSVQRSMGAQWASLFAHKVLTHADFDAITGKIKPDVLSAKFSHNQQMAELVQSRVLKKVIAKSKKENNTREIIKETTIEPIITPVQHAVEKPTTETFGISLTNAAHSKEAIIVFGNKEKFQHIAETHGSITLSQTQLPENEIATATIIPTVTPEIAIKDIKKPSFTLRISTAMKNITSCIGTIRKQLAFPRIETEMDIQLARVAKKSILRERPDRS